MEVEKINGQGVDWLMDKLAANERKAEEKREAAEAKKNRQAAKEERKKLKKTEEVPSLLFLVITT